MAALSGDILRFTTFQTYLGEQALIVDFRRYLDDGGAGNTYQEIADQYELALRVPTQQYAPPQLEIVSVLVENMSNAVDFLQVDVGVTGNRGDAALPSYVAFSVKLNRESKITRNGSKRLCGITENSVTNNDVVIQQSIIDDIEEFYGQPLIITAGMTNDFTLEPVIVGRTLNPATGQYELDLTRINRIVSASMSGKISTQNTRKPNIGS